MLEAGQALNKDMKFLGLGIILANFGGAPAPNPEALLVITHSWPPASEGPPEIQGWGNSAEGISRRDRKSML